MEHPLRLPIATPRLLLRPFTEADDHHLFTLDSDPQVTRYVNGGQPPDMERIRTQVIPRFLDFQQRYEGLGFYAVEEKESRDFIGWFHFRPKRGNESVIELGYRLMRKAWGKGYATEGAQALLAHGFTEFGVLCVEATALVANAASIRVMEKCGLRWVENYVEESFPGDDKRAVRYQITVEEWLRKHPDRQYLTDKDA